MLMYLCAFCINSPQSKARHASFPSRSTIVLFLIGVLVKPLSYLPRKFFCLGRGDRLAPLVLELFPVHFDCEIAWCQRGIFVHGDLRVCLVL